MATLRPPSSSTRPDAVAVVAKRLERERPQRRAFLVARAGGNRDVAAKALLHIGHA